MADNYIKYIADVLKALHPHLSSQGFINHVEDKVFFENQWNWDDFFTAMAWEGLKGEETNPTEYYQSEVIDNGLQDIYDFYVTESNSEGSSNKCE